MSNKSGKYCRNKGHNFEREIAIALRKIFPEARRHLEYNKAEAKGYDLDNTGQFKIQCKRNKKYAPITKILEAEEDCSEGEVPVLITKGDRTRPVVCLYLQDWINLLISADPK